MKAGFSKFEIPGNKSFSLAGYADRSLGNLGVNDPVEFNVAYLETEDRSLIICSGDVVGINYKLTNNIRKKISEKFNISEECIMINATHTHSSYAYTRADKESPLQKIVMDPDLSDQEYEAFDTMQELLYEAIQAAKENILEANISYINTKIEGLGLNRNNKDKYYDNNLHILKIENNEFDLIGLIITATCHPTILNSASHLVSSDYPGYIRKNLESKYASLNCVFLQGPAGEVSTRYTRKSQDISEVERMGKLVSDKVLELINNKGIEIKNFKVDSPEIIFFRKVYETDEIINKRIDSYQSDLDEAKVIQTENERKLEVKLQGARINKYFKDNIKFDSLKSNLQIVDFGDVKMIGIPGEPFGNLTKQIYKIFGENTIIVGYSNDYVGYILGKSELNSDIYEKEMMVIDENSEELILNKLKQYK